MLELSVTQKNDKLCKSFFYSPVLCDNDTDTTEKEKLRKMPKTHES